MSTWARYLILSGLILSSFSWAANLQTVSLALIQYADDPRYRDNLTDARSQALPWGRLDQAVGLPLKAS